MKNVKNYPGFLAAIDYKKNRIFVLGSPNLSAVKIDGEWQYTFPLSDEEIKCYELVTDLVKAQKLVKEAKSALNIS